MTTQQAIYAIVERKRSKRIAPDYAFLSEITEMTGQSFEEARREAVKLAEAGEICIRQTLNREAYEPVGISDNLETNEK